MIGDVLSFLAGTALLISAILVIIAYRPANWSLRDAPGTLAMAIALGFAASASNTLYWQVFGQPAVTYGWLTVAEIRAIGDFADVLFKGGAAIAGLLHLRALLLALPESERGNWSAIEMPFYPNRRACLKALSSVTRKVTRRG